MPKSTPPEGIADYCSTMLRRVWRDHLKGTAVERPLRRTGAILMREPQKVRSNRLDDWALIDLIATLPPNANCIDVGANVGDILRAMVTSCPDGNHRAFEPIPFRAAELQQTFPSVQVHAMALSNASGTAEFSHAERDSRSGLTRTLHAANAGRLVETIPVQIAPLDTVVDGRVDLVKIDVEGAELEVLEGARGVLQDSRPLIAFEQNESASGSSAELHGLLTDAGYCLRPIRSRRFVSSSQFVGMIGCGACWNFLAVPDAAA